MSVFIKMIQVFFLAMIKYFYAPIYGIALKLEFWHTYFSLISGGLIAFLLYYNITGILQIYLKHFMPHVHRIVPNRTLNCVINWKTKRKERKKKQRKFTRWNKFLIKLKRVYGMWGIILLTPVLISLPIGAFLLRKYYSNRRKALPLMLLSIVVEGLVLCIVYYEMIKI